MPSFCFLEAGVCKAKYVCLRVGLCSDVLTGDWRFQRSPVAQPFSSLASCLDQPVWRVEKADAELLLSGSRCLQGDTCVFLCGLSQRRSDQRLALSALSCVSALQQLS